MPLGFKLYLGLSVFVVMVAIVRRLSLKKYIMTVSELDDAKKSEILKSHSRLISYYRSIFWLSPLFGILIYIFYVYSVKYRAYLIAAIAMMYLLVFEDYFFRKGIVNKHK